MCLTLGRSRQVHPDASQRVAPTETGFAYQLAYCLAEAQPLAECYQNCRDRGSAKKANWTQKRICIE